MGNLGGPEILVIFLVALIVLGPRRLPEAARQVGKAANELKKMSSGFQRELRDAIEEPLAETRSMLGGALDGDDLIGRAPAGGSTEPETPTPDSSTGADSEPEA